MKLPIEAPIKRQTFTSGKIHVAASLYLEWHAFEEYCTENKVLPDIEQLQSWALEQIINSNNLDEMLHIRKCS